MKARFPVTFEVVTRESATYGDAARRGYLRRSGEVPARSNTRKRPHLFTLKEGIDLLQGVESSEPIEVNEMPLRSPRWFTAYGQIDEWGECVSLSLHIPEGVTTSSRIRIARLLECYAS